MILFRFRPTKRLGDASQTPGAFLSASFLRFVVVQYAVHLAGFFIGFSL
jgi:hypothetical protein